MLKKFIISFILIINLESIELFANEEIGNEALLKLPKAYPDFIKNISNNKVIWIDNYEMDYDDNIQNKTFDQMLSNPSLKDQMSIKYIKTNENPTYTPRLNEDAGRIRYQPFFKKMYGSTQDEVKKNLTKIIWLPKSSNKVIWVTKINDVDKKFQKISDELDLLHKELRSFIDNPSGTFNWRQVSATNRLSTHSFGIAIDINVNKSNYWKWDNLDNSIKYKNKIPLEIVKIFEKYGFIWGGKWYHYDTMHFEYRPELLN
jgi:peptidoglycan LD-endopeptidase CwlK